ncbi:MAG TPA: phage holin family protein [Nitrospiraceae bacterium]|jgi:hypothetical protein|nr:phage holin family protein [Nitrospiraceae bacterium]
MAQETIHTFPSLTRLVAELLGDIRTLVQQHLQLMRDEFEAEVSKVKRASISVAVGAGLAAIGGLLFILMLVHLLQWATGWPLWSCYGLVGLVSAGAGAIALWSALKVGSTVHVMPVRTLQSMKEDAQWISETIASKRT